MGSFFLVWFVFFNKSILLLLEISDVHCQGTSSRTKGFSNALIAGRWLCNMGAELWCLWNCCLMLTVVKVCGKTVWKSNLALVIQVHLCCTTPHTHSSVSAASMVMAFDDWVSSNQDRLTIVPVPSLIPVQCVKLQVFEGSMGNEMYFALLELAGSLSWQLALEFADEKAKSVGYSSPMMSFILLLSTRKSPWIQLFVNHSTGHLGTVNSG